MEDYKLIDYDHTRDDLPCNAVLSDMDGLVEAVWLFDHHDGSAMEQRPVIDLVFKQLWTGIADSVSAGGVFCMYLINDPTRIIDPAQYHVISSVQEASERVQHRTFMVPADESDPTFTAWLGVLMATTGLREGDRAGQGSIRNAHVPDGQASRRSRNQAAISGCFSVVFANCGSMSIRCGIFRTSG